jgi:putative membrane protein insertion efficiency factor
MMARFLVALIHLYQRAISPHLGAVCRFEPSCSRYAVACLEAHGAVRGGLLSIGRLCKCHPFHPGGFDPPPLGAVARSPVTQRH